MTLTEEQLRLRRSGVSASEVSSLVGEGYLTPFDLWCLKQPSAPRVQQNAAMGFGTHLESAILGIYSERVAPAVSVGSVTLRHPEHPLALATLDGRVVNEARAVECKAVDHYGEHEWGECQDTIPVHYYLQIQWQLFVADLPECDMAALFGLREFKSSHNERTFRVTRDDDLCAMLLDLVERFWHDHVETGIPPEITGTERSRHLVTALHPRETGPTLPWTPEAYALATMLGHAKDDGRAAKARADDAANKLRRLIGDAAGIGDASERVTWKAGRKGKTDWKAVATAAGATPEIIAEHTVEPSRTLRIKGFQATEDEGDET